MDQADIEITKGGAAMNEHGMLRPIGRALTVTPRCGSTTSSHPVRGDNSRAAAPVWLAALMAVNCQARGNGLRHDVCWQAVAGRALYTNFGSHAENIEPLGVSLPAGDTLAVYWSPGETAYTVEVYSDTEKCA
jgi:hypothetical protein